MPFSTQAAWSGEVGDLTAEGNTATFNLKPGHYTLEFAAVRNLRSRANGESDTLTALARRRSPDGPWRHNESDVRR